MSAVTKRYKRLSFIFGLLSLLCTVAPVTYFTVLGFMNGEIRSKVTLGCTLILCLVLVSINIIKRENLRSPVYIMILGIYICLDNLLSLFLIMAITTILDEMIFAPLHRTYKNRAIINREIDKRNG